MELTDTSDDGVGNIANELVKQGLVTATFTEQVCLYGNVYGFLTSWMPQTCEVMCWSLMMVCVYMSTYNNNYQKDHLSLSIMGLKNSIIINKARPFYFLPT